MKHTEAKAFVRKYNAELSIRGYSKMKKADLERTIESKINKLKDMAQMADIMGHDVATAQSVSVAA